MASSSSSRMKNWAYPHHVDVHESVTEKLSGTNFFVWKTMMLTLIESHGLLEFIKKDAAEEVSSTSDWKKVDGVLKGWIQATVTETFLPIIADLDTARAMWSFLCKIHGENFIWFEESSDESDSDESDSNEVVMNQYHPLTKAALHNDWEKAAEFIKQEPNAVRSFITVAFETALMISVRYAERLHFTRELVAIMHPKDLALSDASGFTALHIAAQVGNIEAAKLLVDKDPSLLYACDPAKLQPIHHAADAAKKEMFLYLMAATDKAGDLRSFQGESGSRLLALLTARGFFDTAISFVQRYPESAVVDRVPLTLLACKCLELTRSEARLNFWQRMIYSGDPVNKENHRSRTKTATSVFISVPQVKQIQEKKRIYHQARQLINQIVGEIIKLENTAASKILLDSLILAANLGIHDIVECILDVHPTAIYSVDNSGRNLFHVAILNRQEKVYNLIYQIEGLQYMFLSPYDQSWNRPFHAAGYLEKDQKIKLRASAAGAALQMQRELQWFKEVEKMTPPNQRLIRNAEGKTASILFTETHQELGKEAEKWVKDTSNSCTIVAALIATVVFAAAITVPGGNNSNTGLPFHTQKNSFTVFAISDALALFSSTSSLLIFLSTLTSQYSEADFLYALPKKLIIGLTTLFLSIIFMMITFSAAVRILFGDLSSWVLFPVVALACIPVTLFTSLQFSLLVDIIRSTYGSGIFGKQNDRIIY